MRNQPFAAQLCTGMTHGKDFGMGGGVMQLARTVSGACNHLALWRHDHSAHGHFSPFRRRSRLFQRLFHITCEHHSC